MATVSKINKTKIEDIEKIIFEDASAMKERTYNLSSGMTKESYDFTEMSYERDVRTINNVAREVWYLYDKNNQKVAASAFFAHDKNGVNFSGCPGNDVFELTKWLFGHKLTKSERKGELWGAKFEKGELVERNTDLGEERSYYNYE